MVKIYSKPNCQPCKMTKRMMDQLGVVYEDIDITRNMAAFHEVVEMGYQQAPVVVTGTGQSWSGFNISKIRELV